LHKKDPANSRFGGGAMDELIERLTSKVGLDKDVARRTVGLILGFLRTEGPTDKVQALIDSIPGAEDAIEPLGPRTGFGKLLGGGMMALGAKLMGLGLGMAEIQNVARELFKFGRDKIGTDGMQEIITGTPGLNKLV
jgi:hypothetical protein